MAEMIKYPLAYNPILEYWEEIEKGNINVGDKIRRTYKKVGKRYKIPRRIFLLPQARKSHIRVCGKLLQAFKRKMRRETRKAGVVGKSAFSNSVWIYRYRRKSQIQRINPHCREKEWKVIVSIDRQVCTC